MYYITILVIYFKLKRKFEYFHWMVLELHFIILLYYIITIILLYYSITNIV